VPADQFLALSRAALPPLEGSLAVPGLRAPVEVRRDRWGVPHISAASLQDLYLAQGFVAASERLFQIETTYRASQGTLSELIGPDGLETDRAARRLGRNLDHLHVAETLDERSVEIWQAWLAGVHAFVDHGPGLPPEYQFLDTAPGLPRGDEAPARMAAILVAAEQSSWQTVLLRVELTARLGPEAAGTLLPGWPIEPMGVRAGGPMPIGSTIPASPMGVGSNAWAVHGSRTASGKPIVAYDPHLPFQTPGWTEWHLSAPGFEVAGASHPAFPGVVAGHTDFHGWGITSGLGNTTEVYLEQLDEDGTATRYDGGWEPLTVRHEQIAVRGQAEAEVVEFRATRHGPIVADAGPGHVYSVQFSGTDGLAPSAIHDLAVARSWPQFREALRSISFIHWNIVYGDADGTIGYQLVGPWPRRRHGDGTVPSAGWLPEHEWDGEIPFDELPTVTDPAAGYVASSNNRPVDESYPYALGRDFAPPWRIRRVTEVLASEPVHTVETSCRLQTDTVSVLARELSRRLVGVAAGTARQQRAMDLLRSWDGDLDAGSAAAALYQAWKHHLVTTVFETVLGAQLLERFAGAASQLPVLLDHPPVFLFGTDGRVGRDRAVLDALELALDQLGDDPDAWRWSDHHRVEFCHPLVGEVTAGIAGIGGDGTSPGATTHALGSAVATSGGVWRGVVDLADVDRSVGVLTTGVSGNPASPHWDDQFDLWVSGQFHALPWTSAAVETATIARMELTLDEG